MGASACDGPHGPKTAAFLTGTAEAQSDFVEGTWARVCGFGAWQRRVAAPLG
jgi:hypothetical protein